MAEITILLLRKRNLFDVADIEVTEAPPQVRLKMKDGSERYMLPGDVVWITHPGCVRRSDGIHENAYPAKQERIICTHRYGVPYFICTKIGFPY